MLSSPRAGIKRDDLSMECGVRIVYVHTHLRLRCWVFVELEAPRGAR